MIVGERSAGLCFATERAALLDRGSGSEPGPQVRKQGRVWRRETSASRARQREASASGARQRSERESGRLR
jgi:hypothetical protein